MASFSQIKEQFVQLFRSIILLLSISIIEEKKKHLQLKIERNYCAITI